MQVRSWIWRTAAATVLLLWVSTGQAQDWAKAMFGNNTTYDFGVVARGAKVEHRFAVENIYEEDAHIQSVSSSCGCSTPQVNRQFLKTWEKAEVLVTLDTRAFTGRKDSTIKVVFDQPFPAEVQLHIHAYIRSDVVVQPGVAIFGTVHQGVGAKQNLSVAYAGRDDWRIDRVECANPSIEARAVEIGRTPGQPEQLGQAARAGQVTYSLSVELKKDAPPGYIQDQLMLVTNDRDPRAARVPVSIEGLVVAALSVRPSPLLMGVTEADQPVTRNLVVQGRLPFRITAVRCGDERFQCKAPTDSKLAHVLPVTFSGRQANDSESTINATIRIETDLAGAGPVEVGVSVQVKPAAPAGP
jgi:hypothetical protein